MNKRTKNAVTTHRRRVLVDRGVDAAELLMLPKLKIKNLPHYKSCVMLERGEEGERYTRNK